MTKKTRNRFTKEQKDRAVDDYLSEARSAKEIALDMNTDVQTIYRWKVQREERAKGLRLEELVAEGNSKAMAQKFLEKELEIQLYQKKIAEQALMIDLLKKLQTPEDLQPESELSGLIRDATKQFRKRKPVKL